MRTRGTGICALIGALIAVTVAGCAAGTAGPPHVNLSVLAPTSGATVNVRSILVFGRVSPGDARVFVGGRRAAVHGGSFHVRVRLARRVNHIGILADANGYRPALLATIVRVSKPAVSAAAPASRAAGSSQPALPGDFATRAEAICSATAQQIANLPRGTLQTFAAVWRQHIAIRMRANRQLIALMGPAVSLSYVKPFVRDLHTMAAIDVGILNDLLNGNSRGAVQLVRRAGALAPRWWQDGGRLGVPDCGATTQTSG